MINDQSVFFFFFWFALLSPLSVDNAEESCYDFSFFYLVFQVEWGEFQMKFRLIYEVRLNYLMTQFHWIILKMENSFFIKFFIKSKLGVKIFCVKCYCVYRLCVMLFWTCVQFICLEKMLDHGSRCSISSDLLHRLLLRKFCRYSFLANAYACMRWVAAFSLPCKMDTNLSSGEPFPLLVAIFL